MSQSHWEAQSNEQCNGMDRGRGWGEEAMSTNYRSGAVSSPARKQGQEGTGRNHPYSEKPVWFSLPWICHCDLSSVLGSKEERERMRHGFVKRKLLWDSSGIPAAK